MEFVLLCFFVGSSSSFHFFVLFSIFSFFCFLLGRVVVVGGVITGLLLVGWLLSGVGVSKAQIQG